MHNRRFRFLFFAALLSGWLPLTVLAQDGQPTNAQLYNTAMEKYDSKEFPSAAKLVVEFLDKVDLEDVSKTWIYNAACILALGDEPERAMQLLTFLANKHTYSNLSHIQSDTDLKSLHDRADWNKIIERVAQNHQTQPARTRSKIKSELLKARSILQMDGGKLWGHPIWSTDIIVLDFDNTIYSLKEFPDSKSDGFLFYKTIQPNVLSFTNSAQTYRGKRYAVVMANYIDDESSTIIHELFHILQLAHRQYRSDPVEYLDNHDAREWLRLEFQALRNGLKAANSKADSKIVESWLADAVRFRKLRQTKYQSYLRDELEIETLEGMANYTGIVLSSVANKFETAIAEINGRERAATYTRPFPYATGPAYGLLFDHLKVDWKSDMQTIYNFLKIFENHIGKSLATDEAIVQQAKARNNYAAIHKEELAKKLEHEKNLEYYSRMLLNQPTLRAEVNGGKGSYSTSFDMNGTLVLGNHGIVYSHVKGVDLTGENFGSFRSTGNDILGTAGILRLAKDGAFVFPYPTSVDGLKIVGDYYEIELNEGWRVSKNPQNGNLRIVRDKEKEGEVND